MDSADRAGWTKNVLLDEHWSFHGAHPAADPELTFQTRFIQFNSFQNFGIFFADRSNVRRETIDRDHALWRRNGGECLDQSPGGIRNNRAALRMPIGACAEGTQLEERDALEAKADDRILFRVARAFVPQTAIGFQQFRVFAGKAIQARAAQTVLALDAEAQRDRQFAKSLLIGLDCRETGHEI